jgi:hypothetical protein
MFLGILVGLYLLWRSWRATTTHTPERERLMREEAARLCGLDAESTAFGRSVTCDAGRREAWYQVVSKCYDRFESGDQKSYSSCIRDKSDEGDLSLKDRIELGYSNLADTAVQFFGGFGFAGLSQETRNRQRGTEGVVITSERECQTIRDAGWRVQCFTDRADYKEIVRLNPIV